MNPGKTFVDLYPDGGDLEPHSYAGLILPLPTGVVYRAWIGGSEMKQGELEGAFIPLPADYIFDGEVLDHRGLFRRPTIEEATAAGVPVPRPFPDGLGTVPPPEAWVPLVIEIDESKHPPDELVTMLRPFNGKLVVLTWPNMD